MRNRDKPMSEEWKQVVQRVADAQVGTPRQRQDIAEKMLNDFFHNMTRLGTDAKKAEAIIVRDFTTNPVERALQKHQSPM
jgi:hypothetical protein